MQHKLYRKEALLSTSVRAVIGAASVKKLLQLLSIEKKGSGLLESGVQDNYIKDIVRKLYSPPVVEPPRSRSSKIAAPASDYRE